MHFKHKLIIFFYLIICIDAYSYDEGYALNETTKIAYRDYGPSSGTPILLVTGLGAQLTLWPDFLIDELQANNFRPIVYDNRDVGLSSRFSSQPSQFLNYLKYFFLFQLILNIQ